MRVCIREGRCIFTMHQGRMRNAGRSLFLFGALLLAGIAQAQLMVRITVLDSTSGEPIPMVELRTLEGEWMNTGDYDGMIVHRYGPTERGPFVLKRSGYLSQEITLPERYETIKVYLVQDPTVLPGFTAKPRAPEPVFKNDTLHAAVFEPGADGLWVLAYTHPRLLRDGSRAGQEILRDVVLVLLDTFLNEVARKPLPGECTGLHIGRHGEAYVLGTDRVWGIDVEQDAIRLSTILTSAFNEALRPWTDSTAGHWLGSNYDATFPGFDHLAYEPVSEIVSVFCSVQDTFMMQLFRSQYKYMSGRDKVIAMDMELTTGVDRELWAGRMTGFHNDLYFKPPYAPLFVCHDTILVFDHTAGRLKRFDRRRAPIGESKLLHHTGQPGRAFTGKLLHDRALGEVYAVFEQAGRTWLCSIDPRTAAMGPRVNLDAKWPEQVRVHGGQAYYIHRPFESTQKRTLYREQVK